MSGIFMAFPSALIVLLIVCGVISALGFYRFLYFISVGYGFSIAGSGLAMLILFWNKAPKVVALQCIILIIYGVRLGGYLLVRDLKSKSYHKTVEDNEHNNKKSLSFQLSIWISVVIMYVAQVSPILYRLNNGDDAGTLSIISLVIMISALMIETIADQQKTEAKRVNPNRFCDKGLYRIIRCPNYFGELLFWIGVYISGISTYRGLGQWLVSGLGILAITYVMFSGGKRIEERQDKNYENNKEYQEYKKRTPILIPGIPLYSLKKYDWLKA